MSRVDEDREAARTAARLAETKRTEEQKKAQRSATDQAFSKLVSNKQAEDTQNAKKHTAQKEQSAKSTLASVLEHAEAHHAESSRSEESLSHARDQAAGFKSRIGLKDQQQRLQGSAKHDGDLAQQTKLADDQGTTQSAQSRASADSAGANQSAGRKSDAKVQRETLEERSASSDSAGTSRKDGAAGKGDKGDLKTDADKGGGSQQQGGGQNKDGGNAGAGATMRFNPALMAPPPVAKPRDMAGSERLRKIATELAQKIVERVRVGENSAGRMEFQIDLRSDVLSGLSVKVSSHNGKIKAVFSGRNRDVLKMIEEQSEALKNALSSRGLSLEDLKIEARA